MVFAHKPRFQNRISVNFTVVKRFLCVYSIYLSDETKRQTQNNNLKTSWKLILKSDWLSKLKPVELILVIETNETMNIENWIAICQR